jgi:hypothetical protein
MSRKQESSFCEQKETKKLHSFAPRLAVVASAPRCTIVSIEAFPHQTGKSLFASFSSEKEGLPSFGAPA